MINRIEDYQYVYFWAVPTGATAPVINGEIMPLRDATRDPAHPLRWKNVLRGEDIAFLLEAVYGRYAAWYNSSPGNTNYPYRLDAGKLATIADKLNLFYLDASDTVFYPYGWLKSSYDLTTHVFPYYDGSGNPNDPFNLFWSYQKQNFCTKGDAVSNLNPTSYTADDTLRRSVIEGFFTDVGNLYRFFEWSNGHTNFPDSGSGALVYRNNRGTIQQATGLVITDETNQWRASIEPERVASFIVSFSSGNQLSSIKYVFMQISGSENIPDLVSAIFSAANFPDYANPDNHSAIFFWEVFSIGVLRDRTRWQTP